MRKDEKSFAGMHLDYWLMRNCAGGDSVTVLSMKDASKSAYSGLLVSKKGKSGNLAVKVVNDIMKFGHGDNQIVLKSDGENAMGDLLNEVRLKRKGITLVETSPRYESQSNGIAERGVQSNEGQVRTLKLGLEDKIKCRLPVTHTVMTWLVPHAADLLTKYIVGKDGRTGYERIRGKKYIGEMLEF